MTIFVGTWDVTIDTPIGKIIAVFDITEQGGSIHGVARSDAETVDFYDVLADGSRLTWMQDVSTPMKLSLRFDVEVEGDTMTGTSAPAGFPVSKVSGIRSSAS